LGTLLNKLDSQLVDKRVVSTGWNRYCSACPDNVFKSQIKKKKKIVFAFSRASGHPASVFSSGKDVLLFC
jgi:hypothetical protein